MRVAKVDGLVTLFYDESKELLNEELEGEWNIAHDRCLEAGGNVEDIEALEVSDECKNYKRERLSWQQVIIVDGVTEIPGFTFMDCYNIKIVIFADTVFRIQILAFNGCKRLSFIKWSFSLEHIGENAFGNCNLSSIFIPPSCRQIGPYAFAWNENLTILNVPQDAQVDDHVIRTTKLLGSCPHPGSETINTWLNINNHENFALHRVCSSFEPTLDMILNTMIEKGGPKAFKVENSIGITPSRYLKENPYANVKEIDVIDKYILQMVGEL